MKIRKKIKRWYRKNFVSFYLFLMIIGLFGVGFSLGSFLLLQIKEAEIIKLKKENQNLIERGKEFKNILQFTSNFELKKLMIYEKTGVKIPWEDKLIYEPILDEMLYQGKIFNIPDSIHFRLVWKETGGTFNINSLNESSGASGLYQLMPLIKKSYKNNKKGIFWEIFAGCSCLSDNYKREKRWDLALSRYNSGKISKDNWGNKVPYQCKETIDFVEKILNFKKYEQN